MSKQQLRCPNRATRWMFAGMLAILWLGVASVSKAASYTLEIIQPRAGLSSANRYYKAYPGLLYDVQLLAIGGKYPYHFSLLSAPAGMTIDANSGVISWPSPAAQAQPYGVTAQ